MSFIVLKKERFFSYFENTTSENLGFYFSFFLHLIFLFFVMGLPNFFSPKTIVIPTIIPIEIVNITEFDTSIPKKPNNLEDKLFEKKKIKEKNFNSSDNQEIKKVEIKKEPNIQSNPEEKILSNPEEKILINPEEKILISKKESTIKEKEEVIVKLKNEKINLDFDKVESLPTKKIKPKLKPQPNITVENLKTKPSLKIEDSNSKTTSLKENIKAKPNPVNSNLEIKSKIKISKKPLLKVESDLNIASLLKDLRNEKSSLSVEEEIENDKKEVIDDNKKKLDKESENLAKISIANAIAQQIQQCWIINSGEDRKAFKESQYIVAEVEYKKNGDIVKNSVQIIDTNIVNTSILISGVTYALYNCRLELPVEYYYLWKKNKIRFDHDFMKKKLVQKNLNLFN